MWKQIYSSHMNFYPRETDEHKRSYLSLNDANDNNTKVTANEVEGWYPNQNETGSRSPCMRPRSDPPNFGPITKRIGW